MLDSYILFSLLLLPLIGVTIIFFIPKENTLTIKQTGLNISLATFILSLYLWINFDNSTANFQFVSKFDWIPVSNLTFYLGIDGISLFFVILTTFLIPICLLTSWNSIKVYIKEYVIAFLVIETLLN